MLAVFSLSDKFVDEDDLSFVKLYEVIVFQVT